MNTLLKTTIFAVLMIVSGESFAQFERRVAKRDFYDYYNNANYDETLVPEYTLPDLFACLDGTKADKPEAWEKHRRGELIDLFTEYMYGRMPMPDATFSFERMAKDKPCLNGKIMRRDIMLHLTSDGPDVRLTLLFPRHARKMKTILGLSFADTDSVVTVYDDGSQPKDALSWPVEKILQSGFALALFRYTDAEGDKAKDMFRSSKLHKHFYKNGQTSPLPNEWGAVACWSWTASRAMDAIEKLAPDVVDLENVTIMGHSRLGKTALWAGATDERFARVVAVNSGCCGAALSRRCVGETVECVNEWSYQWFCGNFRQFSHKEETMPFDQHELLALVAPRKLMVISGKEDLWSDPKGEGLACESARPVWQLYGKPENIVYILREGPHAVLQSDWQAILNDW